jgi:hypothetical protein
MQLERIQNTPKKTLPRTAMAYERFVGLGLPADFFKQCRFSHLGIPIWILCER